MATCGTVQLIRGPRGAVGASGADGTDGVSAFTLLTAAFTMPAELATAVATVGNTAWITTGNTYYLQGAGWLQATAIADSTHVTLLNLEDTANDAYLSNVAPGTVIPISSSLVAAGIQGPAGADGSGGAPVGATYITQTPNGDLTNEQPLSGLATGFMFNTTATGVISIITRGVANANVAPVDDAGGLTAGEAVFATATGIESQAAATSRTSLGLGTMATQAANTVAITGGTMSGMTSIAGAIQATTLGVTGAATFAAGAAVSFGGKVLFATSNVQSLLAATAISPDAAKVRVVGSGGAVTLTATPTITPTTTDGQFLIIMGTSDANTVTLQDKATAPGSALNLGAGTRVLGAGDTCVLLWDLATTEWYELSFNNV